MAFYSWTPYVPVAERRANACKEMEKLRKQGVKIQPVELVGRTIARSFWGKAWSKHLDSFSDYENRLPRGRTYVRNGSVCHLEIKASRIEAMVSGSSLYKISMTIKPLAAAAWTKVKEQCRGQIGSMLELLQGRFSDNVMAVVSERENGLFPKPGEMTFDCSCPDWAVMCKHVAAALYGVAARLDTRPELLFILRGVDPAELISAQVALPTAAGPSEDALAGEDLSALFDIDLDAGIAPSARRSVKPAGKSTLPKKSGEQKSNTTKPTADHAHQKKFSRENGHPVVMTKLKPKATAAARPVKMSVSGSAAKPVSKRLDRHPAKPRTAPAFNPGAPTGAAVARLRARTGMTEAQFARALGVSTPTVHRWESSRGSIRLHSRPLAALVRLQKKLMVPKDRV